MRWTLNSDGDCYVSVRRIRDTRDTPETRRSYLPPVLAACLTRSARLFSSRRRPRRGAILFPSFPTERLNECSDCSFCFSRKQRARITPLQGGRLPRARGVGHRSALRHRGAVRRHRPGRENRRADVQGEEPRQQDGECAWRVRVSLCLRASYLFNEPPRVDEERNISSFINGAK